MASSKKFVVTRPTGGWAAGEVIEADVLVHRGTREGDKEVDHAPRLLAKGAIREAKGDEEGGAFVAGASSTTVALHTPEVQMVLQSKDAAIIGLQRYAGSLADRIDSWERLGVSTGEVPGKGLDDPHVKKLIEAKDEEKARLEKMVKSLEERVKALEQKGQGEHGRRGGHEPPPQPTQLPAERKAR
jgi:hypothetical protein